MHRIEDNELRSPFEREPEILKGIGTVVSLWGGIHNIIRQLVAQELECNPDEADIVLSRFSGEDSKIDFLMNLILSRPTRYRSPKLYDTLSQLRTLINDRNILVHGIPVIHYRKGEKTRTFSLINPRAKKPDLRIRPTRDLLDRHLENLRTLGWTLFNIAFEETIELYDSMNKSNITRS